MKPRGRLMTIEIKGDETRNVFPRRELPRPARA